MIRLLFLFSSLNISLFCYGQNVSSRNNRLEIIFNDTSILKLNINKTFRYFDSINYGHPVFLNRTQNIIQLDIPTFLRFADQNQTSVYVKPGEKIYLNKDEKNQLVFSIKGDIQRTNELNFFNYLINRYKSLYNYLPTLSYHKEVASIDKFKIKLSEIATNKENRIRFLDSFPNLSDNFRDIAKNEILSSALSDTILLIWSNRYILQKEDLYNKFIYEKLYSIKNTGYLLNSIYLFSCQQLINLSTTKFLNYELRDSLDIVKRYKFIQENLNGTLKEYLISNTFYTALTNSIPISEDFYSKFISTCQDKNFTFLLERKLYDKKLMSLPSNTKSILLSIDGKTTLDFQNLLNSYKGKYVYIDFWASWCAPCRVEMPFSNNLKHVLKNKDIVFIYLSTDENISSWKNASDDENIDPLNSYLILNSFNSPLISKYKIQTIPRYILFDREGRLLNIDAPRPSDPKLLEVINSKLN